MPTCPEDLNQADFIDFDSSNRLLLGLNELSLSLTKKNFTIQTENHLVQWQLAKQGLGICIVPEDIGDAEPLVQQVLPDMEPMVFPIWLTAHRELKTSRRDRLVFDLLADELAR
jgi:DNA-binding transcriptional LysR family regulator